MCSIHSSIQFSSSQWFATENLGIDCIVSDDEGDLVWQWTISHMKQKQKRGAAVGLLLMEYCS